LIEAAEIRAVLERAKGWWPARSGAREHALVITKLEEALMWAQRRDEVVREEEPRA
jgi:hypothetical protein